MFQGKRLLFQGILKQMIFKITVYLKPRYKVVLKINENF